MPTSTILKKSKVIFQGGFTLLEILIALLLISIILAVAVTGSFDDRQALDETLETVERAFRFGADEAAIGNKIIRVNFILDQEPQEYSVEFGPDDSFVLPLIDMDTMKSGTIAEKDEAQKKVADLNSKFSKVKEFEGSNRTLDEQIRIIGVGTTGLENMVTDFPVSIYIYPSGEKDGAIIVVGSETEIATIEIDPFSPDIRRTYNSIDLDTNGDIYETQINMATELFKKWQKK